MKPERLFATLLDKDPKNGRIAAGMGFLRMQQSNFGGAISYLAQAEQDGYTTKAVEDGLANSRSGSPWARQRRPSAAISSM